MIFVKELWKVPRKLGAFLLEKIKAEITYQFLNIVQKSIK